VAGGDPPRTAGQLVKLFQSRLCQVVIFCLTPTRSGSTYPSKRVPDSLDARPADKVHQPPVAHSFSMEQHHCSRPIQYTHMPASNLFSLPVVSNTFGTGCFAHRQGKRVSYLLMTGHCPALVPLKKHQTRYMPRGY